VVTFINSISNIFNKFINGIYQKLVLQNDVNKLSDQFINILIKYIKIFSQNC